MNHLNINIIANKLVKAFLNNKFISPIPTKYTRNILNAEKLRKLCEQKINRPVIGFKAGGTGIALLKKLKEKEPFIAAIYKHNFLKNNKNVKINKYTLGIELEVCFLIKKSFFKLKKPVTKKNFKKFISHMAPCIEVIGYRQKKKKIQYLGDLSSDFGANFKFVIGKSIKFKNINFDNLKTVIFNTNETQKVEGNTNTVYINPLNSLRFVLNKIKKENINLKKNFYIFTGSTVGVVPILGKGIYTGKVQALGNVSTKII